MHEDLRRKALESKKTVSKKSKSKQSNLTVSAASSVASSRAASATNSKDNSRAPSRDISRNASDAGSDDESPDDELSELGGSYDGDGYPVEDDVPEETFSLPELDNRVANIIGRGRRRQEEREDDLFIYVIILRHLFAQEQLANKVSQICTSLVKAVANTAHEKEQLTALRALQVTIVTESSYDYEEKCSSAVRSAIESDSSTHVKVEALHALGLMHFLVVDSEDESEEIMDFLLEIVSSDGHFVNSHDDGAVVAAAAQMWTLLATQMEDLEAVSSDAIETFAEQLDSADAGVQIACGVAIALLYEKSFTPVEEDEEVSDDEDGNRVQKIQRYEAYRRKDQLLQRLTAITRLSPKSMSKKTKRALHANFQDIVRTVTNPIKGPKLRKRVRINDDTSIEVDAWWKLVVIDEFKRVLQAGFLEHYRHNKVIIESAPALASSTKTYERNGTGRKPKSHRQAARNGANFVGISDDE